MKKSDISHFCSNDTLLVKGVAIILMVCNHLFPIPEWIYPENQFMSIAIGGKTLAAYVGGFSKICVGIFALLTGVAMFYAYSKQTIQKGYSHTLKKLPHFFLTYWLIIILIYIPVMLIAGVFQFDIREFILNMFGYKTTYCRIAWYVRFYLELVVTFPVWVIVYNKLHSLLPEGIKGSIPFASLIVLLWLIRIVIERITFPAQIFVTEYLEYIPIVMAGYYIADKKLFDQMANRIYRHNPSKMVSVLVDLAILGCCFLGRGSIKEFFGFNLDFVYAPIVIFVVWQFFCTISWQWLTKGLTFLGRHSLEIWFLHAIFFIGNPVVQKVGYWPRISILILIWVIVLLIPFAVIIQRMVECVVRRK